MIALARDPRPFTPLLILTLVTGLTLSLIHI